MPNNHEKRKTNPLPNTQGFLKAMKLNYSISFYTGGVNIEQWQHLTKEEKEKALSKRWYLKWSFRNPSTGNLERQRNFYGGVNRLKTKTDRLEFLNVHKRALKELIEKGYSPYEEKKQKELDLESNTRDFYTVESAFKFALQQAEKIVSPLTVKDYTYAKNHFMSFIGSNNKDKDINKITKNIVISFLNDKLKNSSARNRNNYKSSLSALFTILERNNVIERNFIREIPKIKTVEKIDRTFSSEQLKDVVDYLKKELPYMILYVKFISYNFLRPVEVNRLKVKDINLEDGLIYFKAKNKAQKTKRIPFILLEELKKLNLKSLNKEYFLFSYNGSPGFWEANDNTRRDRYSKRFKIVKDHFNLSEEYGLYSFRHTFITNFFRYLRTKENMSYAQAIDYMLPITGHSTQKALDKYIHSIDADIPEDWSDKIEFIM